MPFIISISKQWHVACLKPNFRVLSAFPGNATSSALWSISSASCNIRNRKSLLVAALLWRIRGFPMTILVPACFMMIDIAGNVLEMSEWLLINRQRALKGIVALEQWLWLADLKLSLPKNTLPREEGKGQNKSAGHQSVWRQTVYLYKFSFPGAALLLSRDNYFYFFFLLLADILLE